MRVLQLLLLLAAVLHNLQPGAAMHTPPSVHTDSHMGIRVYSFPLQVPKVEPGAYELRVYLRTICESSKNSSRPDEVLIKGFAGAFPVTGSVPAGVSLFSPHFQPPALRQHMLHITSSGPGGSSSSSTTLKWLGPANQGLWRLDGPLRPTGREMLSLEGSTQEHQLVLSCGGGSAAGLAAQHRASAFPTRGLWNVVTTTSANRLPPDTLAHLLMLHLQYHERLGFDGAILRCNKGEAQALVMLPHIEVLVAARKLVIWPWVHEHSTGHTPFYWQKPRNQLTLLAAYGHSALRLAFFDLDEFLVLPQGGTLASALCNGRPLLQAGQPAASFARYSARSCVAAPVDLQCWLGGAPLPTTSGVELLMERCPCQFHKPLLRPQDVLTMSVHFVWPAGRGKRVADVPHGCGFLLHLHALVHQREHFMPQGLAADHIGAATWVLPLQGGSARIALPTGGNATAWLHDTGRCATLRKAAASGGKERKAQAFSVC